MGENEDAEENKRSEEQRVEKIYGRTERERKKERKRERERERERAQPVNGTGARSSSDATRTVRGRGSGTSERRNTLEAEASRSSCTACRSRAYLASYLRSRRQAKGSAARNSVRTICNTGPCQRQKRTARVGEELIKSDIN